MTTAIPLGQLSRLAMVPESTFGTAPATGYSLLHFYRESIKAQQPKVADMLLGGAFQNDRDNRPSAPGLLEHSGEIEVPLCLNQIGHWLRMCFGAPSTSGTTNKTHAFASGAATIPSNAVEMKLGASDWRMNTGLSARSIRLQIGPTEGFHRATLTLAGKTETLAGSTGAGTPTAVALDQVAAAKGVVRFNTVQMGQLLGADVTYSTGVELERYCDDIDTISAAVLSGYATIEGTLRMRYTGQTVEANAVSDSAVALDLEWTKTANNKLTIAIPRAKLERMGPDIGGPGGIEQTLRFKGEVQAGTTMTTWTLLNQIASYA